MGEQPARIGFKVWADGQVYYLSSLQLVPHETRMIDLRKLRDAQEKDLEKHTIPAGATEGSVTWLRLDNVPVMGRLAMVTRHGGVASSYDCCYCECPAAYNYSVVVPADACPLIVPTDDQMHDQMWFAPPCGGSYYYDATSWVNWSSSNPSVFTLNSYNPRGLLTTVGGGTANAIAQGSSECRSWYQMGGSCLCSQWTDPFGITSCSVVGITGPQTVWWFNGQTPSGYATTITLTALPSGATTYSWSVVAGASKAALQNQSSNTIDLRGTALSTALSDVTVQVGVTTAGGTKYATRTATVRGPYKLVPGYAPNGVPAYQDTTSSSNGYLTYATYTIQDNFTTLLPYSVPLNENWTTSVVYDYSGSNWTRGNPLGYTTLGETPAGFADHIYGPPVGQNNVPTPTGPQNPLGSTKVFHWGQEWRIGSQTPGLGARVQTDTLQYYVDHGRHPSIVSPAP